MLLSTARCLLDHAQHSGEAPIALAIAKLGIEQVADRAAEIVGEHNRLLLGRGPDREVARGGQLDQPRILHGRDSQSRVEGRDDFDAAMLVRFALNQALPARIVLSRLQRHRRRACDLRQLPQVMHQARPQLRRMGGAGERVRLLLVFG